jgi:class 3 adenylate cyclase
VANFADPDRRVLVVVDMESYSGRDNVLQYRAQLAFQEIMKEACDELGFDRANWLIQQGGDGELAILPVGTSEKAVVTRLAPTVERLLREHNRGLAPEARIRLRIGVHQGPVHLDGANGYPGDAVVTVCRLVDSPQLKSALRRFPGAEVALIVSDRTYQDIVRHYRDLRPEHFLRVAASLPQKNFEAVAWIYVPGENAAHDAGADDPRADIGGPGRTEDPPEGGLGSRRGSPAPQPSGGGQVFQDITSHGPTAFGNGNVVSTSGVHDVTDPRRPQR